MTSIDSSVSEPDIKVIKRNGTVVPFQSYKIRDAVLAAFNDPVVTGSAEKVDSTAARIKASNITLAVVDRYRSFHVNVVSIEEIQDQVELALMRAGEVVVAREYIKYRERRKAIRDQFAEPGTGIQLDESLVVRAQRYCRGVENIDPVKLATAVAKGRYNQMSDSDLQKLWIMESSTLIEKDPGWSFVAARILIGQLQREAFTFLEVPFSGENPCATINYESYFPAFIHSAIAYELLDPALSDFNLELLAKAIKPERDLDFSYLAMQTLYDRYFIHVKSVRIELPQALFMRVAMGLALSESDKNAAAIEFYNLLSSMDYMTSTPTLFNSGTVRPQCSSCYLTSVPDDLYGIYGAIRDNAMLSKWAGGLGNDWTPVRALGAYIKGTNGKSQGVVPFLKVANDTAVAVNQGGKRKGALCAYLETWHLDIEEFLELRKNTGDDRRRTHDMNTANWVPDLFMKRVFEDGEWTLLSPSDAPDLHELYGAAFEQRYAEYEAKTRNGEITHFKRISAVKLWRKMLGMLFETGHPWITFKDACNLRSPQQHCGVIHSSNLCTEITLNTKVQEEIAVCNLGSVNLVRHIEDGKLNTEKLQRTVRTAMRMLDNVVDINYYSVEEARTANLRHRPVGLGLMGFHDALKKLNIPYASEEAVRFSDESMEYISYFAIDASCELARERGPYSSFKGSLWSQGILPIDSLGLLAESRGKYLEINTQSYAELDWTHLRNKIQSVGMRNSNVLAIAPTATIANICNVSQSIDPLYQNLFVKSNLSGEFTMVDPLLVKLLQEEGIWDEVMINDLKYFEGSVQQIERVPERIKMLFATAFEIEPRWPVECAARRQKWMDQAQSLNLYISNANGKKLDTTYRMAFMRGLKTTYYLRTLAATGVEKSTVDKSVLNAVPTTRQPQTEAALACSIENPETCEACQ